jgi:hypothetical protein
MARRRAGKASAAQLARIQRDIQKGFAKEIEQKATRALALSVQEFAVRSMNGLAKAGPAWTGEFSQSWVFVAEGESAQSPTARARLGIGTYNKNDAPLQRIESYLKNNKDRFQIVNTSEHAAIAIDEQEALFAPPKGQIDPIKEPVEYGISRPDQEHLRWQIRDMSEAGPDDQATSQITAKKDWFTNYLKGGQLQQDLTKSVRLGFRASDL